MGDFTSKYRVNYSDGSSRVEERLDVGKVGSPIVILAFIIFALIAAIPALVLLPLYFYLRKPYKSLKPYVKADKSVLSYKSEAINRFGYQTVDDLYSSTILKFWGMFVVLLIAVVIIDYVAFSEFRGGDLLDLALASALMSLGVAVLAYPIGLLLMAPNRKATAALLDLPLTINDKMSVSGSKVILIAFLSVFILPITLIVAVSLSFEYWHDTTMENYENIAHDLWHASSSENSMQAKQYFKDKHGNIDLNDSYSSMPLMYDFMDAWDKKGCGQWKRLCQITRKQSAGVYIVEELFTKQSYNSLDPNNYQEQYSDVEKSLSMYQELGGSLSIVNPNTGKSIAASVETIEVYDYLKKQGVSFKGYEVEVLEQTIERLEDYDTLYTKRLANMTRDLGLSKDQASEVLGNYRRNLIYYGHKATHDLLMSIYKSE